MKHLFIINPAAGKTMSTEELEANINEVARKHSLDYEIVLTQRPGHATEIARAECEKGEQVRLYACGGDGTLNEVVNGAVGYPNAAVTQMPTGTGNDFIKIFGEDCEQFRDLEKLIDGETRQIDVVNCGSRYSVNVCSVGFDARIGTEVHKYTSIPLVGGKLAYDISAVVNIIKGIHQPMHVTAEGFDYEGEVSLVCVCNGRFYGGGYMPVPEAEPDDGYLDVLLVKGVSRLRVAQLIGKYSKGLYRDMADIIIPLHVKSLTVMLDRESPVNVDGELETAKTITFTAEQGKLNFFFPKGIEYRKSVAEKTEVYA